MSTIASELIGALVTSAAPEILPMMGNLVGKIFGVPAVSRIAAGTMWNLCTKKSSSEDIEMREMGRSSYGRPLRSRTLNRAPSRSSYQRWQGIRFNRTHENAAIRSKQRFVGLIAGGQTLAALTLGAMAVLSHLALISVSLSPLALGFIGLGLVINAFCALILADHYHMDKYTFVPKIDDNNWDQIDTKDPLHQSNVSNTIWFGLSSLVGPLACFGLLFSGASDSYKERERYMRNN